MPLTSGKVTQAAIALGSNLGDRCAVIRLALQQIARLPQTRIIRIAPLFETAPVGPVPNQPPFLNSATLVATTLPARSLLEGLQEIEVAAGRSTKGTNGPRILDLDLICYGDLSCDEPGMILPHPRAHLRAFVLVPLATIAGNLPLGDRTVNEWLAGLPLDGVREAFPPPAFDATVV